MVLKFVTDLAYFPNVYMMFKNIVNLLTAQRHLALHWNASMVLDNVIKVFVNLIPVHNIPPI